jgi:hypothetical protein
MKNMLIRAMICGGLLVFSLLGILIFSGKASWCNSGEAVQQEIYNPNVASTCSTVTGAHTASVAGVIIFGVALLILGIMAINASDSKS